MTKYEVMPEIKRLMSALSVSTFTALAGKLGLSESAVSAANRRAKGIPPQWLIVARKQGRVNPDWVLEGPPHNKYL